MKRSSLPEVIYETALDMRVDNPFGMLTYLCEDLTPEDEKDLECFAPLIKKAVAANPAFQDHDVYKFLKELPLFYLLGIEKE